MSAPAVIPLRSGSAELLPLGQARELPLWRTAFASHRKDHRYYELLGETLGGQFDFRCLVLRDASGEVRALQPLFVVEQDMLATAPRAVSSVAGGVRRLFPRFLRMRMLMVGCPAGHGELGGGPSVDPWVVEAMHEALGVAPRQVGASLVVLKDFPSEYRHALQRFSDDGYERLPSMPDTRLRLEFADFEDYMARRLSRAMRKSLRRKFRTEIALTMEVSCDVSGCIEEVYPLYLQVYERSALKFEKLTREYLVELGRRMPDRARFFIWRLEGKAVAFSVCLVDGEALHDEYLGLDYGCALEHHLYFRTFRDLVGWAVKQGLRHYYSTPLGYDPKLHLGFELAPLDLYARHCSAALNPVVRRVLRRVGPTRSEPVLERFSNAHEL